MTALALAKGPYSCAKPGCNRLGWRRDPALVACPDCLAPVGIGCRRPSGDGGPFVDLHASRDFVADAAGAYGSCPLGLYGLANKPRQPVQQELSL
jgi:hypothetical protein